VTGTLPDGRRALVIWRKRPGGDEPEGIERDNLVLDEWFVPVLDRARASDAEHGFDVVYVNGDTNLESLRNAGEVWTVRLIEEDFLRLMFDTEGA
jgi:adenine-specific DNA-methyltransferase